MIIILLFLFISGASSIDVSPTKPRASWADGPDFRLETKIYISPRNSSRVSSTVRLTEYYSNKWGRAKLEFHPEDRFSDESFRYFYDGTQLLKQKKVAYQSTCVPAPSTELSDDLIGVQEMVDLWPFEAHDSTIPGHLIGLARLAFIINAHQNDFKLESNSSDNNHDTVCYNLKMSFGSIPCTLYIYYPVATSTPGDSLGLPILIEIMFDPGHGLFIEFAGLRLLNHNGDLSGEVENDSLFMFPIGMSCSDRLKEANLLEDKRTEPRVLSFRATVENFLYTFTPKPYFVAYDGYAGVMRRDTFSSTEEDEYSITITDIAGQRSYNIKQPVSFVGEREFQIQSDENQCVTSKSYNDMISLERVIPFKSLVEMGPATVRGIESVAFERVTEILPAMLFPPLGYLDRSGVNHTLNDPNVKAQDTNPPLYTLVYYFAAPSKETKDNLDVLQLDGKPLGPLLRVEVLKRNQIIYNIDIEEFVWQLVDAPNGDRSDELFSVNEKCSSDDELRAENFATINLDLKIDLNKQKAQINSNQLVKILASHINRNNALVRALTHGKSLAATEIRDLDSKVHRISDAQKLVISVAAKLRKPSKVTVYEAVTIGTGAPLTPRMASLPLGSVDMDGCFWEALHRRKRANLVFSYCYSTCIIDDEVEIVKLPNNTLRIDNLKRLFLSANHPCLVFRVAARYNDIDLALRERWTTVGDNLREGSLLLSILNEDSRLEINAVAESVKIGSDRWSASGSRSQIGEEHVLEGIGLTVEGDGGVVKVEPKGAAKDEDGESLPLAMSYSVCHSSCVASVTCRSFSLCSSGADELECLHSPLEFRGLELLTQIEQQSASVKSSSKRQSITVKLLDSNESSMDQDQEDKDTKRTETLIKLRVDKRCHLYNKRALELFSPYRMESYEINDKNLLASDSEERCAEICLGRNMLYFKRAAQTKALYLANENSDQNVKGFLDKIRAQQTKYLRYWCASFAFFNLNIRGDLPDEVRQIVDPSKLTKGGLCYLPRSTGNATTAKNVSSKKVRLHSYEFVYSHLYEIREGFRLSASPIPSDGTNFNEMTPDEARKYLGERNNQVTMVLPNREACARACFMQTVGIVPWCRSFDFVDYGTVRHRDDGTPNQTITRLCIFNSNTLSSALKSSQSEKLVSKITKSFTMRHYEPQNSLSLDDLVFTERAIEQYERSNLDEMYDVKLSSLGILVLLTLSVASGLALGIALSVFITREISSRRDSHLGGLIGGANFNIPRERFLQTEMDIPELPDMK